MDASPGFASTKGGIKNGYNEVEKESVTKAMKWFGKLNDTIAFTQTLIGPSA
jgi:hypothetical protein